MSFSNPFGDDLEAQSSNVSQNYKDYPQFDELTHKIDSQLSSVNKGPLTELKESVNNFDEDVSISNEHDVTEKVNIELNKAQEAFKELNTLIKELNSQIKDIESNHEDVEVLSYLRQKERLLVKSVKDSISRYRVYQQKIENRQQTLLPDTGSDGYTNANWTSRPSQVQGQVQIDYEPINAEQLEQQTLEIEEREREIRQIQRDTLEINDIFENLSTIVNEQQYQIDNIENNVFSFASNTRNAAGELRRAERYQRRSGGRMFCCLLVLLAVLGFIIVVVVLF